MKKKCKAPRVFDLLVSAICIMFGTVSPALANNAPGPLAVVSIFSLVILIVALTFAGGGYAVIQRLLHAKYPSKGTRTAVFFLNMIAGVILFFAGIMSTIIGVLGFSLYAISRGVKMIKWSSEAEKERARPAHLEGSNSKRLKFAGGTLIALTLLVLGYSIVNIGEVTGMADYKPRAYARALNSEAKNAFAIANVLLEENPKAQKITCDDMVKAGYKPDPDIICFSNMTATSGGIRITGPEKWDLKNPVASITHRGELTPAKP